MKPGYFLSMSLEPRGSAAHSRHCHLFRQMWRRKIKRDRKELRNLKRKSKS